MAKKDGNQQEKPQNSVPQGLHNMLAKTPERLHAFYAMEESARNEIIAQAKQVASRMEMENLVAHIGGEGLEKG